MNLLYMSITGLLLLFVVSCDSSNTRQKAAATNISSNLKENIIHSSDEQKVYDDTMDQLWEAYRKVSGNSVLEDEAYTKFINYTQSIGHVKSWIVKVQSATVITDGTCIIDCVDDYKNHPYTCLVTNIPTNVIRTLTRDVFISVSGEKHYDRLNGDFFKGEYQKEVMFQVVNP